MTESATRAIRVLLADDHALVRETLARWLREADDMHIVGEVGSADEAVALAVREHPDVVLLDIDMPGLLAFDAARTIRARCPQTRIIMLSGFFHDRFIEDALQAQASGYVTKTESADTVLRAVRTVAGGGTYFSPEVQARIVVDRHGARLARQHMTRASLLTARELEVLRYIARGLSKKDIAALMQLSVKTIDNHCTNLMTKLDIHDRVELARFAIREGIAEP